MNSEKQLIHFIGKNLTSGWVFGRERTQNYTAGKIFKAIGVWYNRVYPTKLVADFLLLDALWTLVYIST